MKAARRGGRKRGDRAAQPAGPAAPPWWRRLPWRALAVAAGALAAVALAVRFSLAPIARWRTDRTFAHAEELLRAAHDEDAAVELREVLRRDPWHAQARRRLAELELRRGRVEPAFLHLQALTELVPEDAFAWTALAEVRERAGQPEEAEAALTRALDIDPGDARSRQRRAALRAQLGRNHGALVDAEAAVQRDPHDVGSWIVLCTQTAIVRGPKAAAEVGARAAQAAGADGRLLEACREHPAAEQAREPAPPARSQAESWPGELGASLREFVTEIRKQSFDAARAIAHRARERYPRTMMGPWLDGLVAGSAGDPLTAEARYLEALQASPRAHRPLTNLIPLWAKQFGPAGVAERLQRLLDADPGFTYVVPIAAQAWLEASQPAQAEATVRKLFTLLPRSPVPYREVAKFFLQVDRPSDAIATCSRGLTLFAADADLDLLEARAWLALGDRDAAMAAAERALAARPDSQPAAAQLARLLSARTDAASRARAAQLLRDLELDRPSDPDVLTAMGAVALQATGDARRARRWLEAASRLTPDDPGLRFQLAVASARLGEVARAREELASALKPGRPFEEEPEARRLAKEIGLLDQSPR